MEGIYMYRLEKMMPHGEHKNVVAGTLRAHKRCPPYLLSEVKILLDTKFYIPAKI